MSADYEVGLRGNRRSAEEVLRKVQGHLEIYAHPMFADAAANRLKYSLSTLRSICRAASNSAGMHHTIYCEIIKCLLGPDLKPSSNPSSWNHFLENYRYLHANFLQMKNYSAANRLLTYMVAQPDTLQDDAHYKYLLDIYSLHLRSQRAHLDTDEPKARAEILVALQALQGLFDNMLSLSVNQHFKYPDVMEDFIQKMCRQPTFMASLPLMEKTRMYDSFFRLLAGMRVPNEKPDYRVSLVQRHFEAMVLLLQTDVLAKAQAPITLSYLRACRTALSQQSDDSLSYSISLLYYLMKFVFSNVQLPSFTHSYIEMCTNIVRFLNKSSEKLIREQWFMDFLVTVTLLLLNVHQRPNMLFDGFWQRMNETAAYNAHFEMLTALIQLAPRIGERSKLGPWTCCSSIRKHTVLSLAQCALNAFTCHLQQVSQIAAKDKRNSLPQMISVEQLLQQFLMQIIHLTVQTIDTMACLTGTGSVEERDMYSTKAPNELKCFYARLSNLLREMRSPAQLGFGLLLLNQVARMRDKFSSGNWVLLLRRLVKKVSEVADSVDSSLVGELISLHMAQMLRESSLDWHQLRNQVAWYYALPATGSNLVSVEVCLCEWYDRSASAVKVQLSVPQHSLLLWLEAQHLLKYQKANAALLQSLLRSTHSRYEVALVTVLGKVRPSDRHGAQFCDIFNALPGLAFGGRNQMTRLDVLVLGHGCTWQWREKDQKQRKSVDFKDLAEDELEQLMQQPGLQNLNFSAEASAVDMAVQGIEAFERFYELADSEYISMDEALIDWDLLLSDLISLATYCQYVDYVEHAVHAWQLVYRIADWLGDETSITRALTYFCEHAELFVRLESPIKTMMDNTASFDLQAVVAKQEKMLLNALQCIELRTKREQGYLLMCLAHLAFYHAHCGHSTYAQLLLQIVQRTHAQLPERCGKYDLVMATIDAIGIRWQAQLLRKTAPTISAASNLDGRAAGITHKLLRQCLLRDIDRMMERLHTIVPISTTDNIAYSIFFFRFVHLIVECGANRLHDNNFNYLVVSVLRMALQSGSVLRIVQIFNMWAWSNLQMEYVKKAQKKLRLSEQLLGGSSRAALEAPKVKVGGSGSSSSVDPAKAAALKLGTPASGGHKLNKSFHTASAGSCGASMQERDFLSVQLNMGLEAMRKVVAPQLSPIEVSLQEHLDLSPQTRQRSLNRFLYSEAINSALHWSQFIVGCLNARLQFLVGHYVHLDKFYEQSINWLHHQATPARGGNTLTSDYYSRRYQGIELLCRQHHVNFLRAQQRHEAALKQVDATLSRLATLNGNVDILYELNLVVQKRGIQWQLQRHHQQAEVVEQGLSRRALSFDASFEERVEKPNKDQAKALAAVEPKAATAAKTTTRRPLVVTQAKTPKFQIYNAEEDELNEKLGKLCIAAKPSGAGDAAQAVKAPTKRSVRPITDSVLGPPPTGDGTRRRAPPAEAKPAPKMPAPTNRMPVRNRANVAFIELEKEKEKEAGPVRSRRGTLRRQMASTIDSDCTLVEAVLEEVGRHETAATGTDKAQRPTSRTRTAVTSQVPIVVVTNATICEKEGRTTRRRNPAAAAVRFASTVTRPPPENDENSPEGLHVLPQTSRRPRKRT